MLREEEKNGIVKILNRKHRGQKNKEKKKKLSNGDKYQQKTIKNMVDINPAIKTITLNSSGLNIPIKRQRLSE